MTGRPLIGFPTQTLEAQPEKAFPRCWVMSQRYVRVLTGAGAIPFIIPLIEGDEETLRGMYERLDGVFLAGGVDMDPRNYGERRHPLCGNTDPERDWTELQLVRWAIADKKPILAVCRGIQIVNVASGGNLYQDLTYQYDNPIKHDHWPLVGTGYGRSTLTHTVEVPPDSRLGAIFSDTLVPVNSMHHQGIRTLGAGLRPNAFAPDGLIEGVESSNGHFMIGVQWHPEDLIDGDQRMSRLFRTFVETAAHFALAR